MMQTIYDGGLVVKDPNGIIVYAMDWDADLGEGVEISTSTWFFTTAPDAILTLDSTSISTGNRQTVMRLTAGTPGSKYRVTNRIVTNENPSQTKDASFYVLVQDQ